MNSDIANTGFDPSITCIDDDSISIASDFTRISESMMRNEEFEEVHTPMTASFYKSQESVAAHATDFHSKVKFGSIEMIGSESSILSVMFHIAEDFVPKSSDRVGLYKTGFSSSKDFLCFKWTPCTASPLGNPVPYTVLFEADVLPNEKEEFYQICYLMQNGKIAGTSNPFQLVPSKACGSKQEVDEVENAARNVLSIRVRELMKENESLREKLRNIEDSLAEAKDTISHLEKEKAQSEEEKSEQAHLIQTLKETIALKKEHIEKYKMELLEKEEELNRDKLETKDLQSRLTAAVMSMSDLKESLAVTEEGKSITEERQQVLLQDNQDLKESLRLVKEELETCMKEKSAAEKIASDLSQHLQAKGEECQTLALFNSKLVKKVKKQRKVIALMEASEDFVPVEADYDDDDEGETKSEIVDASVVSSSAAMVSGCPSSGMSACPHLNETVNSVSQRMDEIVNQLSWQTEEMKFLKKEITKKREGEEEKVLASSSSGDPKERSEETEEDRDQVLYGKSFLPTNCTAPVFLPSSQNSDSRDSRSTSVERKQTPLQSVTPSAPSPTPTMVVEDQRSSRLPAPLQPVATPLARNVAVLRQFSDNGASPLVPDGQQQEFQQPPLQQQDFQQQQEFQQQQQLAQQQQFAQTLHRQQHQQYVQTLQHQQQFAQTLHQQQHQQFIQPLHQQQQQFAQTLHQEQQQQYHPVLHQEQPVHQYQQLQVQEQYTTPQMQEVQVADSPTDDMGRQQQESDDDDFHSTGDAREFRPLRVEGVLKCPLCPIEFHPEAIHLLEEHTNNHLDRTCPVCSLIFPRDAKHEKFVEHVHSHFSDEDNDSESSPAPDSSGPWDPRTFQLLEID